MEKILSSLFIWYLWIVALIMLTLYAAGINISIITIICFFLFWAWRFRRNRITSIHKVLVNLFSIATGIFILYFSFKMIYNHYTGNAYFYYMADKIGMIMAILSIPFFLPVYDHEKVSGKRFYPELLLMGLSFLVLLFFCSILWKNGFITPFVA